MTTTPKDSTPVKITVDSGYSPRYVRYGYLVDITDCGGVERVNLRTPARERFAAATIPAASVVEIDDATAAEVEANPGRIVL